MRFAILCTCVFALALGGCGDDVQLTKSKQSEASPPQAKASGEIATHGESDPFAVPGGESASSQPSSRPAAPGSDKPHLSGTISLDPSVKLPKNYVLYILSGFKGSRAPLAVTRHVSPKFPFNYKLTGEHQRMGGDPTNSQPVELRAILSESGDIMKHGDGLFLRCVSEKTYAPGSAGVNLTIKP